MTIRVQAVGHRRNAKSSKSINVAQGIWKHEGSEWTYTGWCVYTGNAAWLPDEGFIKESQRLEETFSIKVVTNFHSLCGKRGTKAEWSWRRKTIISPSDFCHELDQVTGMKRRRTSALGERKRKVMEDLHKEMTGLLLFLPQRAKQGS